jgi:hypothetical protein
MSDRESVTATPAPDGRRHGSATASVDTDDDAGPSYTAEERRRLVAERLGVLRSRRDDRSDAIEIRLRSPAGQLLRYDRDGEVGTVTEGGVVVTATREDVVVNTDASDCRIEAYDTDVDAGVDRVDLGSCGVVEVVR